MWVLGANQEMLQIPHMSPQAGPNGKSFCTKSEGSLDCGAAIYQLGSRGKRKPCWEDLSLVTHKWYITSIPPNPTLELRNPTHPTPPHHPPPSPPPTPTAPPPPRSPRPWRCPAVAAPAPLGLPEPRPEGAGRGQAYGGRGGGWASVVVVSSAPAITKPRGIEEWGGVNLSFFGGSAWFFGLADVPKEKQEELHNLRGSESSFRDAATLYPRNPCPKACMFGVARTKCHPTKSQRMNHSTVKSTSCCI